MNAPQSDVPVQKILEAEDTEAPNRRLDEEEPNIAPENPEHKEFDEALHIKSQRRRIAGAVVSGFISAGLFAYVLSKRPTGEELELQSLLLAIPLSVSAGVLLCCIDDYLKQANYRRNFHEDPSN